MRIPTYKAAAKLGLHPADFLLSMSHMVGSLSDCWPEVDEGFVDTVGVLLKGFTPVPPEKQRATKTIPQPPPPAATLPISDGAARILDKMERADKWGKKMTVWDQVNRVFAHGVEDVDAALDELKKCGLLEVQGTGKKAQFSLNTSRQADIERIVKQFRASKQHD